MDSFDYFGLNKLFSQPKRKCPYCNKEVKLELGAEDNPKSLWKCLEGHYSYGHQNKGEL